MSRRLQPSVPLVTLVKTEPPTLVKNEPPEEVLEKEISLDIKNIDIPYYSLSEDLIKSEFVPENILEPKYWESVETQVLVKTEDTSDENVTRDTKQEVIEVQGSHEHSNTLSNLETHEQLFLNSCNGTASWEKEKEKIKIVRARDIPVVSHECTSLAEDEHVCRHCQRAYNTLRSLKNHIRKMHDKVTTMYQCPYCSYQSKWSVRNHIIQKHKDTKDIEWFQCNLCEMKFKFKYILTRHKKVHLRHQQMKDGLDLPEKRHHCKKCDYKTYHSGHLKNHELIHLKPEKMQYFYCYHCSNKFKRKFDLKKHIFRQHFKNVKQEKRHHCDECDYETDKSTNLKIHKLNHLKPEEIQYFYCYHCFYKAKLKNNLKRHLFTHFKKEQVKFDCYICNFVTPKRESIIKHIKKHSKVQNKFEINEGS